MSNGISYVKYKEKIDDNGKTKVVSPQITGKRMRRRPKTNRVFDNGEAKAQLMWGDRIRLIAEENGVTKYHAREFVGEVDASALGKESLLEIYFIDVGQGDGVLIRTPDNKHILIDAGFPRSDQPVGKNASDFVDWKFIQDYELNEINLDVVIASHNDSDHYGGLWDLLNVANPAVQNELDAVKVTVENFYHAGIGWWKNGNERTLGEFVEKDGEKYFTQLMGDRDEVIAALQPDAVNKLQGEWAKFMDCVTKTKRKDGSNTPIQRLSNKSGFLPGFAPGESAVTIKVLAPIEVEIEGTPALKKFEGGDSISTNGNSILLRLDYKNVRILLTGDLNTASQTDIMKAFADNPEELECDIAKSCHHGSDDISYKFMTLLKPSVTIISSGDSNGHDHPRPNIVGTSAVTGHLAINKTTDELIAPLIYSTELARSFALGRPEMLTAQVGDVQISEIKEGNLDKSKLDCLQIFDGPKGTSRKTIRLNDHSRVVTDIIYGLVNVRTDGERILCATLNETNDKWDTKVLFHKAKLKADFP